MTYSVKIVQVTIVGLDTKKSKKVDFDLHLENPWDYDAKYTALLLFWFFFHILLNMSNLEIRNKFSQLRSFSFYI